MGQAPDQVRSTVRGESISIASRQRSKGGELEIPFYFRKYQAKT